MPVGKFDYNQPEADKDFEKERVRIRRRGLSWRRLCEVDLTGKSCPSFSERKARTFREDQKCNYKNTVQAGAFDLQ